MPLRERRREIEREEIVARSTSFLPRLPYFYSILCHFCFIWTFVCCFCCMLFRIKMGKKGFFMILPKHPFAFAISRLFMNAFNDLEFLWPNIPKISINIASEWKRVDKLREPSARLNSRNYEWCNGSPASYFRSRSFALLQFIAETNIHRNKYISRDSFNSFNMMNLL